MQLLPAMGVSGEGGSVRAKLMESLPVIKQINEEFRDPVNYNICNHLLLSVDIVVYTG